MGVTEKIKEYGLIQIFLIINMLALMVAYFIEGGWAPLSTYRAWFGYVEPFGTCIIILGMMRNYIMNIIQKPSDRIRSLLVVGSFIIFVAIGWDQTAFGGLYLYLYDSIINSAGIAIAAIIAVTFLTTFTRVYIVKSNWTAVLVGLTVISLLTYSGLGDMIWSPITPAGNWIFSKIGGAADAAFWFVTYLGLAVLVVRVLFNKEKLRPS